MTAIFS